MQFSQDSGNIACGIIAGSIKAVVRLLDLRALSAWDEGKARYNGLTSPHFSIHAPFLAPYNDSMKLYLFWRTRVFFIYINVALAHFVRVLLSFVHPWNIGRL